MNYKSVFSKHNELTKEKKQNNEKKKAVFEQITESKYQKMSLENGNEKMEKDADKYLMDANKDNKPRKQRHTYNF